MGPKISRFFPRHNFHSFCLSGGLPVTQDSDPHTSISDRIPVLLPQWLSNQRIMLSHDGAQVNVWYLGCETIETTCLHLLFSENLLEPIFLNFAPFSKLRRFE